MKLRNFNTPRLFFRKAEELPLTGNALLDLMQAVLAKGVPFRFCARGWSMEPFIRNGDVITIEPLHKSTPGIGVVVAFIRKEEGKLVVHRVVAHEGVNSVIQGDSISDEPFEHVSPDNILGRLIRVERNGNQVWLGLGLERFLIAGLSRTRLLIPMRVWLASVRKRNSPGSRLL